MKLTKRGMPERMYRASRCCRLLGNPTAYLILRYIGQGRCRPSKIGKDLGMSLPAVSTTLRELRNLDLVRYETVESGREYWVKGREYWVKDDKILDFLSAIEAWVHNIANDK